jgi:hypothetical protein
MVCTELKKVKRKATKVFKSYIYAVKFIWVRNIRLVTLRNAEEMSLLVIINPLTTELNTSAQRCLPRILLRILIFKWLNARRLYKSFDVKGLKIPYNSSERRQG